MPERKTIRVCRHLSFDNCMTHLQQKADEAEKYEKQQRKVKP